MYALLVDLKSGGVPVDGLGLQGHFIVGQLPSAASLAANFARFAQLGLTIEITEMDIRMPVPATELDLAQQARDYRTIVAACLQTPACDAVELGGVFDGDTWVPSAFPGQGAPLLYDSAFNRKQAYTAVSNLLAGR